MRYFFYLLAIICLIFIPLQIALASYGYYITITVYNNSSSTLSYIPVIVSLNNSQLISLGYINASALDTKVVEGSNTRESMVITNKTLIYVQSIEGYQSRSYQYRLGESPPMDNFTIMTGVGGNITTTDSSSIELGNNFTVLLGAYTNTTAGSSKYLGSKSSALDLLVSPSNSGNVTATVYTNPTWTVASYGTSMTQNAWVNRTFTTGLVTEFRLTYYGINPGGYDWMLDEFQVWDNITGVWVSPVSASGWTSPALSCDGNTNTGATTTFAGPHWSSNITLALSGPVRSGLVRVYGNTTDPGGINNVLIEAYKNEVDKSISVEGISTGYHYYNLTGKYGGNLTLEVDNSTKRTSVVLGSTAVANTTSNWVWGLSNTLPYISYLKVYVNETQKLWYEPTAIVSSAIIPDRSGSSNTGTITWGTNPSGLEISVGSLLPSVAYTAVEEEEETISPEVLPPPTGLTLREDTAATGAGLPLYESFVRGSDSLGWSTRTLYVVAMLFTALVFGVAALIATGSVWGFVIGFGATAAAAGGVRDTGGFLVMPWWIALICVMFSIFVGYIWRNT